MVVRSRSYCLALLVGIVSVLASQGASAESLFKYKGKSYTHKDLEAKHQLKLFEAENHRFQVRSRVVEDAVLDLYFEGIAKKEGKSLEQVKKEQTTVKEPSESELKKFYEENRKKIPYPYDQVKGELVRFVSQKNQQAKRVELISKIKKGGSYKLLLKQPVAPKIDIDTKGFYSKGNTKAKVTVVEFADYKCPHCKEAASVFKEVLKKYSSKIHFVFVDFPVIGDSFKIAEGAFCAKKENKYWEFHEAAFEHQGKLKTAEEIGAKVGLTSAGFKTCVEKREGKSLVDRGRTTGEKVGVSGTPTVFINGVRYSKGYTVKDLSSALDDALSGKKSS